MNYTTAIEKLGNRDKRKVANNTYLLREADGTIGLLLHETVILKWKPDGTVILDSGGWKTVTTKDRMNYGPYRISQIKGLWYVTDNETDRTIPFADGMILPAAFSKPSKIIRASEKEEALRKRIQKYAKGFSKWIQEGNLPPLESLPGGDCFYCQFREVKTHVPLGEVSHDTEHLDSHMEEGYYVPSLLLRALETRYRNPMGVILLWHGMQEPNSLFVSDAMRHLRRYLYQQFGLAL